MLIYTCLASRIEARRAETPLGGSGRSPKAWPRRLAGDARAFLLVAFARCWVTLEAADHLDRPWEEPGMPRRNVLYDPNAMVELDEALPGAETGLPDVIPAFPNAGGDIPAVRPALKPVEEGEQAGRGRCPQGLAFYG